MTKIFFPPKILKSFCPVLFLLLVQTCFAQTVKSINKPEELKPGKERLLELKGSESQFFLVNAAQGSCLHFIIDQLGVDVVIAIEDSKGKTIKQVDRPSGGFGPETVTFFVPQTDVYRIQIKAWLADAIVGKYRISYSETSTPTQADGKRDSAENLTSEAEVLRAEGSKENKEKALKKFSEALKIWQELADVYEQAVTYYGLAYTNYELSNHYEAAIFYNRALKLHLETNNEFGQAVNQAGLGAVQYALNENDLAVYNYKRAIEIYKRINNVRGLGIAFHGLGTVQFLSENYDEAIKSLTESLAWRALANDRRGKARTNTTIGKLYLLRKNFEEAERQFVEAEKALGSPKAKNDAELVYYWGRFYFLTEQLEKAEDYLERAIDLSRKDGSKLGEANGLIDLSRVQAKLSGKKKALISIQTAVGLIEDLRQSALDFRTRVNFSSTIQPFYEHYISLLMKINDEEPNKGFDKKALEISEQARSRGLLDQLERRSLIRQNRIKPELLEKERSLHDKLTNLLVYQPVDTIKPITAEFQEVSAQFAEVEAEINRPFYPQNSVSLPTLKTEEIQNNLDNNTVLLEYSVISEESFLWLVSKDKVSSYKLPPGEEIEKSARSVYQCISRPDQSDTEKKCRQENEKLSKILLDPILDEIRGKRLIIIKNGFLHYIPFTSLIDPQSRTYLIETNEILTAGSASILSFIKKTKQNAPTKILAVFADPVYSHSDARIRVKRKSDALKNIDDFPRLFASRFEAERISSFLPSSKNILVKMDFEASRDSFFSSNLGDYQILHFATHAFVNDKQPELSAIALSFYKKNGDRVSGFLRPNDVVRLDLNANLVVLSGCQTGLGKPVKGEGIVSLGQSFFSAGARQLIVSLWDVDDKVTAELMSKFYRKHLIEKRNVSSSLREAQLEILRDSRWKSPFYWAAFTLEGN